MTSDLLKSFVLAVATACLALFVQIPFAESVDTVGDILLLTTLEETLRFAVLFLAIRNAVFSKNSVAVGIFFGLGFASIESLLLSVKTASLLHTSLLFLVHVSLSVLIVVLLRGRKYWAPPLALFLALALHMGYNLWALWFARF